jgi:integrase
MPRPNRGPHLQWLQKRERYYIVWYEHGRQRQHSARTADRESAEAALEEFLRQRRTSSRPAHPCPPSASLIAEVLDLYANQHAPEAADPARIGYAISALLPYWGGCAVAEVTKATCQRYAKERGRAPATVRRELATLKAALRFAHREGYLASVPAVWMPPKPEGRDRWLTKKEAALLLEAARTARADVRLYLPLFIVLGLYTGARKQAILSLRWPQVDLTRKRLNFNSPGQAKTSKGRAHIPIPDRLMTFLRLAWHRRPGDLGFVVHDCGKAIKDIGDGRHGSFGAAVRRAGLADVTPHTLRHTCGTWMAQRGVDLWEIAGWLGQSYATTTELYAHHHPDHMEQARKAADRRLA